MVGQLKKQQATAAGYKGPVKIELFKGAGLLNSFCSMEGKSAPLKNPRSVGVRDM